MPTVALLITVSTAQHTVKKRERYRIWSWYELPPVEDRELQAVEVVDALVAAKLVREAVFAEDKNKTLRDRIYIPRPLRYQSKVRIGFDVHGTIEDLDSTTTVKNDPTKGPGYIPPSAWHFQQFCRERWVPDRTHCPSFLTPLRPSLRPW